MAASLRIEAVYDGAAASQGLGDLAGQAGQVGSAMSQLNRPAQQVMGGLFDIASAAADAASDLQQSGGAIEAVFDNQAAAVDAYAQTAAERMGLAESAYEQTAAVVGKQLESLGMSTDGLADQTDGLMQTAADLAATYGGDTADAIGAISSLLRGERDPIERYGVAITAADVAAQKAAMGLDGLSGEADKAATAQATLALLTQQTASSAGQFAAEADSAAGSQAIATASWQNAQAVLGGILLPVITAGAQALAGFAQWAGENAGIVQVLVAVLAALAFGVVAYNTVMGALPAIQAIATAAQWAWNAAMAANPVMLIIIAIVALIAIIVLVVKHWDTIKATILAVTSSAADAVRAWVSGLAEQFNSAWQTVRDVMARIGEAITNGFRTAVDVVMWVLSPITNFLNGIAATAARVGNAIANAFSIRPPSWLSNLGGFFFGSAVTATSPEYVTAATSSWRPTLTSTGPVSPTPAAAQPIVININGGYIDRPTLDRLKRQLEDLDRSRGLIPANAGA